MLNLRAVVLLLALVFGVVFVATAAGPGGPPVGENILLIVMDDIGVESFGEYAEGRCLDSDEVCSSDASCECRPQWVQMDRVEELAEKPESMLFRNVWSQPSCSPTRATILTGRYGYRNGVVDVSEVLSEDEFTLPEILKDLPRPYATAAFGKWHLSGKFSQQCPDGAEACLGTFYNHPYATGFDHFEVAMGNLNKVHSDWKTCTENEDPCVLSDAECTCTGEPPKSPPDYFNWTLNENGSPRIHDGFSAKEHVNNARAWIQQQEANPQGPPWFVYFNFNLVHSPYQVPELDGVSGETIGQLPPESNDEGDLCERNRWDRRKCYNAMLEAMDYQLGRLLYEDPLNDWPGIPDDTTVILVGDNGTPSKVTLTPFQGPRMKGSPYEGGINVPLIIQPASGWSPSIEEPDALIHTVDLFGLVLDLAGANPPEGVTIDSRPIPGFDPQSYWEREWVLAEMGCNTRAVRDERYKLIDRFGDVACPDGDVSKNDKKCDELFDLETDPFELDNLLPLPTDPPQELLQGYDDLRAVLDDVEEEILKGTPCYEE